MLYNARNMTVIDANTGECINALSVDTDRRCIEVVVNGQPEWQGCIDVQVKRGLLGGVKEIRCYGRQG